MSQNASTYRYHSAQPSHMHEVFVPPVIKRLKELRPGRVLDLGCGNGSLCHAISQAGIAVEGCDPSEEGIAQARSAFSDIRFRCMSIYDEPPSDWLGQFDVIVSTEVVEHLRPPRSAAPGRQTSKVRRSHPGHHALSRVSQKFAALPVEQMGPAPHPVLASWPHQVLVTQNPDEVVRG